MSGTRADLGLMLPTLRRIHAHPDLELELIITGMHLSEEFGLTVREAEESGLTIAAQIPLPVEDDSPGGMARCGGMMAAAMAERFAARRPDILLLLGDRSEMLAAGFVACLANVPVVHLCGGERSGTIDDSLRHALSRLAHLHLVATEEAAERLIRAGEEEWRIHRVGTPGLVGIGDMACVSRKTLDHRYGLPAGPFALLLFHPVVQDAGEAGEQVQALLDALQASGLHTLALLPNADHGQSRIRERLQAGTGITIATHMPREDFLSALREAELLIGNSSSGIIEAASLGTPVINVGDRQSGRARNDNVLDVPPEAPAVAEAISRARAMGRAKYDNVYGDGGTDVRVAQILSAVDLADSALLKKAMTY